MAAVDWLPASEYPFEQRFIEVGLAARRPELFRADFRLAAARVSLDPPSTPLREWLALPVRQRELQPDVRASASRSVWVVISQRTVADVPRPVAPPRGADDDPAQPGQGPDRGCVARRGGSRDRHDTLNALPVLTVLGERNDPAHWQARYARAFSNVRSVTVPGGNHFPFADDPDLVADEVTRWWREAVAPNGARSDRRST